MNVTISTDASFNKKLGIGTYALWITSDLGRIKMSGRLRGKMIHSTHCEMACIVNAIYVVTTMPEWLRFCKRVIINTDCMNAIHLFTKDKKAIKRYRLHANLEFKSKSNTIVHHQHNLKHKFKKCEFIFAHVPAHKDIASPRTYVNDWADKSAKEEMGKYINELTLKTK